MVQSEDGPSVVRPTDFDLAVDADVLLVTFHDNPFEKTFDPC